MAQRTTKAIRTVEAFLERTFKGYIKAPWRLVGVAAGAEWKPAELDVTQYREHAPG